MASAATLLGFLGWLFLDETSHRRTLVASCLGLVLVCLGCVVLVGTIGRERRRGTGCAANYDVVRPRSAVPVATPSALPARLPVGRSVRVRGLVGAAAFLAALTGILAISAGDDTDATAAAAIRAAGAERVAVRVVGVTDVERFAGRGDTDFEARVTVQLPAPEGGSRPVSLDARTHDLPREGGRLAVIYAPGHLDLGAVHGDVDTLDRLLAGTALTPAERWAFLGSWGGVALLVVGVNVGGGALGGVSRLDGGHRAARGTVRGITAAEHGDGGTVLRVRTAHADVHFWAAQEIPAIAQSVADQQVWVCWRAEEGRKRLPAVLIGDEGWCLPGEVYGAQLGGAERDTYVVGEPGAPVEPERRVGLWLPVVSWPLRLPCGGVLLVLPSLAATAGMLTDVSGRGRWGLATAAVVGLLGACVAYLRSESGREGRAGREWGSRQGRGWS
ncbi:MULTISPECIES: hypothetical protein [unclassified Streptomyces]|uniref:hypothetical protein n=1 Tax=unclassified Streptomyces TaxID=2593676 RepID=UPI000DB9FABA|nr:MULTISPECIES: hypothetical protein [unclassified Streptomyces]MYT73326.1 hypothetical protein [Streptomyces sp. SID8367]